MSLPTATGEQHSQTKKRIIVGAWVSGCFGDYIPISDAVHVANPNKHLQRGQQRLYGHVAAAVGHHQYMYHCDNGIQYECASNTLVVEADSASLPPNEFPPPDWHETAAGNDKDPDSQGSEHMPCIAPEQDEEEGGPEEGKGCPAC